MSNVDLNNYFSKYLKIAPFSLAVWRAAEADAIFRTYIKFKYGSSRKKRGKLLFQKPVLDVGCGFGEFAGVFFDTQIEMGIDISMDDLIKAKNGRKYKNLMAVDARQMRFKENTFSTVISVSVLEHIPHPELSIKEVYRVTKKGGIFIYTVPTSTLNDHLFYPQFFRSLGLTHFARLYLETYHKVFKHINLYTTNRWKQMTEEAGFKVIQTEGTFTSSLVKAFDIFLLSALPSQMSRWLIGTRWVWALEIKKRILLPLFNYLVRKGSYTESNIVVIAQKL